LPSKDSQNDACCYGLLKIVGEINLEMAEKSIKKIVEFTEDPKIKGVLLKIPENPKPFKAGDEWYTCRTPKSNSAELNCGASQEM
jgi:hypothetical protein